MGLSPIDANRAEQKLDPGRNPPTTYGHPGAWKAFSKAVFWAPPWLTAVGMPGWLMEAVNPVPGGQVGGSALAGLAATPTAASAATDRSAPMRRLMKTHPSLVSPAAPQGPGYMDRARGAASYRTD
jgi:hypothetical protein